jgi:siroheme synthase-like protein
VAFFSVNVDFDGVPALLVGAGRVGQRKLKPLLEAGARVTVVEPNPSTWVLELAEIGRIRLEPKFLESFLDDCPWVFLSTGDECQDRSLADLAKSKGLWVNSADSPRNCSFALPALAVEGPFRLTVSTGGASPALSARVARELRERYLGYGAFVDLLGRLRPIILSSKLSQDERKEIFRAMAADTELPDLLSQGRLEEARTLLARYLDPIALPPAFLLA